MTPPFVTAQLSVMLAIVMVLTRFDPFPQDFHRLSWLPLTMLLAHWCYLHFRIRYYTRMGSERVLRELRAAAGVWRAYTVAIWLAVAVFLYPIPAAVRFYLSWPFLERQAQSHLHAPATSDSTHWLGLWHVQRIWGRGQGFVWFQYKFGESNCPYGIVRYATNPADAQRPAGADRIWLTPHWCFEIW